MNGCMLSLFSFGNHTKNWLNGIFCMVPKRKEKGCSEGKRIILMLCVDHKGRQ